jgi:hypothetical protein
VRTGFTRFLQDGNRQRLGALLPLKLGEAERRRESRGTAADDEDVDL